MTPAPAQPHRPGYVTEAPGGGASGRGGEGVAAAFFDWEPADLPALVVKMLGGPRAYRENPLARMVFALLRLTQVERVLGYGISLRCIART